MRNELLKRAHERIASVPVLVNLISKREKELIGGAKPLVNPATLLTADDIRKNRTALDIDKCDIALAEVAEGKLIAEIDFDAIQKAEDAKVMWGDNGHTSISALYAD